MTAAAAQLADTARHTGTALNASDSPRTLREALPVFLRHGSPRILIVALAVALVVRLRISDWSSLDLPADRRAVGGADQR
jgi:hypothetical protein